MPKFFMDADEWYPIHEIVAESDANDHTKRFEPLVEVDEKTARRWRRAMTAFRRAQSEMREVYEASCKPAKPGELWGIATSASYDMAMPAPGEFSL